jgi:hypothetical protein
MVNLHPLDMRSDSIMRYAITPVYDPAVVAPAAPLLLGFLAVADFVNVSACISVVITHASTALRNYCVTTVAPLHSVTKLHTCGGVTKHEL